MPRNGSGTYTLPAPFAVANQIASSTTVNTNGDDIAQGLTDSINKDGTKDFAANQSMANFKLTALGTATARTDAVNAGQVQDGKLNWVDGGGTADAITATYAPAITALVDGQICCVRATAANATTTPTFAPNGLTARTIVKNGGSALVAGDISADGHELLLRYDLSNTRWELLNPKVTSAASLASTTEVLTGTDAAKTVTADALAALWEKGNDTASAGTVAVGEGGYVHITGTTTITDLDFSTAKDGRNVIVVFDGALTLTHNATTLVLPGGANITTAAGDTACFVQDNSDNIKCVWYQRASGAALVGTSTLTLATVQATTSGTSKDFTGIPSTAKRIVVMFEGVSFDAATDILVQIGDAGGVETSGYTSRCSFTDPTTTTSTAGFVVTDSNTAAEAYTGAVTLTMFEASSFKWISHGVLANSSSGVHSSGGVKATSAAVDRVRITSVSGTANFDAGNVNILYE